MSAVPEDVMVLEPCPFCGSEEVRLHRSFVAAMSWVSCTVCGLDAPSETGVTDEQAVAYWNHRAARPSVPPVPDAREEAKRIAAEDWLDSIYAKALDRAVIGPDALRNRERIVAFLEALGATIPAERQRLRAETKASR